MIAGVILDLLPLLAAGAAVIITAGLGIALAVLIYHDETHP